MKEYLYLFRGGDTHRIQEQNSPELWQAHMMKWKTWMENLAAGGKLVGGQPLGTEARVLTDSGKKVTDGPFAEGKEVVGGYLMVKAKDLAEATTIAKDCPIFEHDGILEIRDIGQI